MTADAAGTARAGAIAALVSGAPSTLHALATRRDPLEATAAAGSMLLPHETRRIPLLLAAVPVHVGISYFWALALARLLPRRRRLLEGISAGAGIALLDLYVLGRFFPRVGRLPRAPQIADHVAFGIAVATTLPPKRQR